MLASLKHCLRDKMATKLWAMGLMLFTTIFTSIAQVLYKKGADQLAWSFEGIFQNHFLLIGLSIYAFASIIMIIAFKGGEVTVLYPIIATSYIWVTILSIFFFNEVINIFRWIGVSSIFLGIVLISLGSSIMDSAKLRDDDSWYNL